MTEPLHDVIGIGNAIVDVISQESDEFIERFDLTKGSMELIDAERADELYGAMSSTAETSGGSAGNTMAGIASLGGRAAFIGKVRDDHLGGVFRSDVNEIGVSFTVPAANEGLPTARSMVIVTPDAQRTMNTFLGASTTLLTSDIDEQAVAGSSVLYCEGYIWDVDVTKTSIRKAIDYAKAADRKVSFTLSDTFCVDRHHAEWIELLDGPIDILFGNELEVAALTGLDSVQASIEALRGRCETLIVTMSAAGSIIVTADETIEVAAEPVAEVIDTTGAGDLYASGFLYGYTSGFDLATCGRLGSIAAAEVISHVGARPQQPLDELAAAAGIG